MEVSTPSNKNSERGQATRGHLLDVARELFTERGFEDTSVELVLERSGVSKGSLYHHFGSKEALFEVVLDAVEAEVAIILVDAARRATSPVGALRAACKAWVRLARDPVV